MDLKYSMFNDWNIELTSEETKHKQSIGIWHLSTCSVGKKFFTSPMQI